MTDGSFPTRGHRAPTVAICRYDAGNVRSVELALRRLGCEVDTDPDADLAAADLVVLPGVGAARSAMGALVGRGVDVALRERLAAGRPVLGICLGLQLALDWTDEDGGVAGLGLVPGRAVRLTEGRVPRMGWAAFDSDGPEIGKATGELSIGEPVGARIPASISASILPSIPASFVASEPLSGGVTRTAPRRAGSTSQRGAYYYAHSYAADSPATTAWSEGVAAELRWGAFVGCQFHPEKSGADGAAYLKALLESLPSGPGPDRVRDDGVRGDAARGGMARGNGARGDVARDEVLCHSPV